MATERHQEGGRGTEFWRTRCAVRRCTWRLHRLRRASPRSFSRSRRYDTTGHIPGAAASPGGTAGGATVGATTDFFFFFFFFAGGGAEGATGAAAAAGAAAGATGAAPSGCAAAVDRSFAVLLFFFFFFFFFAASRASGGGAPGGATGVSASDMESRFVGRGDSLGKAEVHPVLRERQFFIHQHFSFFN